MAWVEVAYLSNYLFRAHSTHVVFRANSTHHHKYLTIWPVTSDTFVANLSGNDSNQACQTLVFWSRLDLLQVLLLGRIAVVGNL